MARKCTGKPVGPPEKPIDWVLFEQLCAVQCTQSEIASMLKIHDDTLRERCFEYYGEEYSTVYKMHSESGKCSLRRNQFVLSKTNATMGIWLGKQMLGQKDNVSDLKDLVVHEMRAGIRQLSEESRSQITEQSTLAIESSLPDCGQRRELDQIPIESRTRDGI